jgi:hypothetical protein
MGPYHVLFLLALAQEFEMNPFLRITKVVLATKGQR